jgi:hypothetical protein
VQQSVKESIVSFLRQGLVVFLAFAVTSPACTQYRVADDDGGSDHIGNGGAAGSVTAGMGGAAGSVTAGMGGAAGSTATGKGGVTGSAGVVGAGGMTTGVGGSAQDASTDSGLDKPGVDAPNDACNPATSCCGGTCVSAPSNVWTIGALVGTGAACPAGYSSTVTAIHAGVSVGCASGCGCTPPVTGSCVMNFSMAFPLTTGNFAVFGEMQMQCTAAWGGESDIATQISANQPAAFLSCSNSTSCPCDGRVCANCAPTGATAPLPVWQTSMNFCPLASDAPTCTSGQCAPPATKICVMAAGTQPCPAGFTAMGASGSWATGATAAAAACTCGGCGVASGESCAGTLMTVGYGVCTPDPGVAVTLAGQFKGDGTSPPVIPDASNTLGGWAASELFPSLAGTPTPGVCAQPKAVPSGGYTPTGPQTVCCL